MTLNIAVLISGRGSNLQAIIDAVEAGGIKNTVIRVVVSNKKDAYGLERARRHGIPAVFIDDTPFKGRRREYDEEVAKRLEEHGVTREDGLVLLAGYMRILSPEFIDRFNGRIMNIHPSLLPAFPGLEAQKQALEYGVKIVGCTVHFVDVKVDAGPIILQASVPVEDGDTVETLSERILREEHRIYPEAVRLFAEGRLRIEGRKVHILP